MSQERRKTPGQLKRHYVEKRVESERTQQMFSANFTVAGEVRKADRSGDKAATNVCEDPCLLHKVT